MPLERIHRQAFKAAEASHCARDQDRFWEMHDRMFRHQRSLEPWEGHAEAVGLDVAEFMRCMDDGRHADGVRKDMAEAGKAGATGTPSFVLAKTDPGDAGKVTGIEFLRGAQAFPNFKAAIERALQDL